MIDNADIRDLSITGAVLAIGGIVYFYDWIRPNGVRKDVADMNKFNQMIKNNPPKWTHKQRITELKDESWLSDQYLEKLIKSSKNKSELKEIENHIRATKTHNHLLKKINHRIDEIETNQLIKGMIKTLKEKGTSSIDDALDWAGHFI